LNADAENDLWRFANDATRQAEHLMTNPKGELDF
jgi:hypothetical protein